MTEKQKRKVISVIKRDATGAYFLKLGRGKTAKYCVIGGLLHACRGRIEFRQQNPNTAQEALLEKAYGLDIYAIDWLMSLNDKAPTIPMRRRRLIALVKRL